MFPFVNWGGGVTEVLRGLYVRLAKGLVVRFVVGEDLGFYVCVGG